MSEKTTYQTFKITFFSRYVGVFVHSVKTIQWWLYARMVHITGAGKQNTKPRL